jgi:hypothetical protein
MAPTPSERVVAIATLQADLADVRARLTRLEQLSAPPDATDPTSELLDTLFAWAERKPFTCKRVIAAAKRAHEQRLRDALEIVGVDNPKALGWRLRNINIARQQRVGLTVIPGEETRDGLLWRCEFRGFLPLKPA